MPRIVNLLAEEDVEGEEDGEEVGLDLRDWGLLQGCATSSESGVAPEAAFLSNDGDFNPAVVDEAGVRIRGTFRSKLARFLLAEMEVLI